MATDFLIPLAQQLKQDKNQSQAERDFRKLAEAACARASFGEIE
jgi:hypothetical protein